MRIVLASFDRVPSAKGAARHIQQNREHLAALGEIFMVTLGAQPLDARHLAIDLAEPNWLRRAILFHERACRVFAKTRFDVYHVRSPFEGLAVPAGAPLVYEVNGLASIEAAYHHPGVRAVPSVRDKLRRMELLLLERAALVLTPSRVTRELLLDFGVPPAKVRVIPNAPSVAATPIPAARPEVEGPMRLCYLGTLSPWQGLSWALGALARVSVPFRLTVRTPSGERPRRELARRIRKLGLTDKVEVCDPLPLAELGPWLATQDAALCPLRPCERNLVQGGMPLKLLDAMAAGLPVVAPDLPIVRDVVDDALPLYRRHSEHDLAAHVSALAASHDLRRALGERARVRVARHFSEQRQREELLSAYRSIAR